MPRFRKKPVVIEAHQWFVNGDHPDDDRDTFTDPETGKSFLGEGKVVRYFRHPDVPGDTLCPHCSVRMHDHGWLKTLEGGHKVCPGDWIITGVVGERHPIKSDIFAETYEPMEVD